VNLLLDTHTFLWHADGDPRMSLTATALLLDPANPLFLSVATVWEIAIKVHLNKLALFVMSTNEQLAAMAHSGAIGTADLRRIDGVG
jgi:PIN domain nuclease of toxin-antitoxin system